MIGPDIQALTSLITAIDWLSMTATSIGDLVAELKQLSLPSVRGDAMTLIKAKSITTTSRNPKSTLSQPQFDLMEILLKLIQECTAFQMQTERSDLIETIFPYFFVQLLCDQKLHCLVFGCNGVRENCEAIFSEMRLDVTNTSLDMGILSFWNLYSTILQSPVSLSSVVLQNCELFIDALEFVSNLRRVLNGNKVNAKITDLSASVDLNDHKFIELIAILIRNDSKKCLDMIQLSLSSNSLNTSNQNFLIELIGSVSMCLAELDIELITFFPVQKSDQLQALEGIISHSSLFHELYVVHRNEMKLVGNEILENSYYVSSFRLAKSLNFDTNSGFSQKVDHIPTYSWESIIGCTIFHVCKEISKDGEIFDVLEGGNFEVFRFPVITMPNYLQDGVGTRSFSDPCRKLFEGLIINMKTFNEMMILEFHAIEQSDLRGTPFKLVKFKLYRILAVIFAFKQAITDAPTEVIKQFGMLIFNDCMSTFLNFHIQLFEVTSIFIFCSFLRDICFENILCVQLCQEIIHEIMTAVVYDNFRTIAKNISIMKEFIGELDPHRNVFDSFHKYFAERGHVRGSMPSVSVELTLLV